LTPYRQPQFLRDADYPRARVRCPIHGFIRYSENERQIIHHALFRRLRLIRQLALTEYVYPGATHTRFEHSLGVMEVATRAFDALAARRGDRMEDTFQQAAGFESHTLALARQYLRLAALLHDVGHTCFSHAVEGVVNKENENHEAVTQQVILTSELLGGTLSRLYGEQAPLWVAWILRGEREAGAGEGELQPRLPLPPQLKLLKDIVSSQMDADRTDYLLRDSHHCGVEYGRFDHLRMIESLELYDAERGELQLALDRGGVHTFEALIIARYQMNSQVYFHRLRRIYDRYLQEYFRALGDECPSGVQALLAVNDVSMMSRIIRDAEAAEGSRQEWASRIGARRHHRVVHETGDDADAQELRKSGLVFKSLQQERAEFNWIRDIAQTSNHKLLMPGDQDDQGRADMRVIGRGGATLPVGEVSRVLARIPARYQCARIYADVPHDAMEERRNLEERASELWQKA
jgi:HD superfamily phosphohydrolase